MAPAGIKHLTDSGLLTKAIVRLSAGFRPQAPLADPTHLRPGMSALCLPELSPRNTTRRLPA